MLTVARMSSSHSKQNASIPTSLGTTRFALRGQFQPKISPRYHPVGILFRFRALRGEAEEGLFHPYFPTENAYEVRARKDNRGVDLISDVLPFGRLWYGEPNAVSNAIGYAMHRSGSHGCGDSGLRCRWQRDRNPRARGRLQRVVVIGRFY